MRDIAKAFLGVGFILMLGMTLALPTSEAARFARQPARPDRTDIGASGQAYQPVASFSAHNAEQLRRAFFDPTQRGVIPNQVSRQLYVQNRRLLGQSFDLHSGQVLPPALAREAVFLPKSIFGYLGMGHLTHLEIGLLRGTVFLYDPSSRRVQDAIPNFVPGR